MSEFTSAEELFPQLFSSPEAADPANAVFMEFLKLPLRRLTKPLAIPAISVSGSVTESAAAESQAPLFPRKTPAQQAIDLYAQAESIMETLDLKVIGKVEIGEVKIFSKFYRRVEKVKDYTRLKYENIIEMAGPVAGEKVTESSDDSTLITMSQIHKAIATLCGKRKLSNHIELGAGCWSGRTETGIADNSVVLVGANEAASFNGDGELRQVLYPECKGRLLDFETAIKPWYNFDHLAGLMQEAKSQEWRTAAVQETIKVFSSWRWKSQAASPAIVTGLIMATWVQTLWEWRPQVSVLGKTSSGKSMLFKTLAALFGGLGKTCSDATAAGIRQAVATSANIILFDEFDAESQQQAKSQQEVLKMLRSSGRGDSTLRGTSNQKGEESTMHHIVWLAGIQIASPREADKNRYVTLHLEQPLAEERGNLVSPDPDYLRELGQRLLAVAIWSVREAREMAIRLKNEQVEGIEQRVVESYAVPAAALAIATGDTERDGREMLLQILRDVPKYEIQGDEANLISDILGARIIRQGSATNVSMLIDTYLRQTSGWDTADNDLQAYGIRVRSTGDDPAIILAYTMIVNTGLLRGTRWDSQSIDQILIRLPGAKKRKQRVGGHNPQCILLPLEQFRQEYLVDEADSGPVPEVAQEKEFS